MYAISLPSDEEGYGLFLAKSLSRKEHKYMKIYLDD